ncbi:MAG: hypothetical protein QF632_01930 [Candidatus Woesearchaeota archaeon]|jgi:hypothetical protein|nr:hypothetical protein [Candidatus Woesearchaeota archaeon]MDP7323500.1 hypothetical protein [Candidatus Woesearchaeota archaeon]MDP7458186.1 hypothetical protein [Candidatus Woesearchaeota archaeon]
MKYNPLFEKPKNVPILWQVDHRVIAIPVKEVDPPKHDFVNPLVEQSFRLDKFYEKTPILEYLQLPGKKEYFL